MNYYFAPMEGITGYVFRNAHKTYFDHMDQYFTPFIVPTQNHKLTSREKNDILPEHNQGISLVPQILTKSAEDFLWAAKELEGYGYREVNLNLGCPSATVVKKGRGSGFLSDLEGLDRFLDEVFKKLTIKLTIKTRIGLDSSEHFLDLLELYNKYPLTELIVHPRLQTDFYKNEPSLEAFQEAVSCCKHPLCYNGNLFNKEDLDSLVFKFPTIDRVMMGRGLVANPGLAGEMKGEDPMDRERLLLFHDQVLEGYEETISGDKNVLFKMKELWAYLLPNFQDSKKWGKAIRKAQHIPEYKSAVRALFQSSELLLIRRGRDDYN